MFDSSATGKCLRFYAPRISIKIPPFPSSLPLSPRRPLMGSVHQSIQIPTFQPPSTHSPALLFTNAAASAASLAYLLTVLVFFLSLSRQSVNSSLMNRKDLHSYVGEEQGFHHHRYYPLCDRRSSPWIWK